MFVSFPNQDWIFNVFYMFILRWEVIVRFTDIGDIIDYCCLSFFFKMECREN